MMSFYDEGLPMRQRIWLAQGRVCFICDKPLDFPHNCSREHVYPRSRYRYLQNNTVVACKDCNNKKGDREPTPDEVAKAIVIYKRLGLEFAKSGTTDADRNRPATARLKKIRSAGLPRIEGDALSPEQRAAMVKAEQILSGPQTYLTITDPKEIARAIARVTQWSDSLAVHSKKKRQWRKAALKLVGPGVPFGHNRLPKQATPAQPLEGASLGSVWPKQQSESP